MKYFLIIFFFVTTIFTQEKSQKDYTYEVLESKKVSHYFNFKVFDRETKLSLPFDLYVVTPKFANSLYEPNKKILHHYDFKHINYFSNGFVKGTYEIEIFNKPGATKSISQILIISKGYTPYDPYSQPLKSSLPPYEYFLRPIPPKIYGGIDSIKKRTYEAEKKFPLETFNPDGISVAGAYTISNIGLASGHENVLHEGNVKSEPTEFFLVFHPFRYKNSNAIVNDLYQIFKVKYPLTFVKTNQPVHWTTKYEEKKLIFKYKNKEKFIWKEIP